MAGAYVALPPTPPTPPDKPPGWGDWPFPDAIPPGYTPVYTINLTAPASVAPEGSMDLTATLRDHATYETSEPASVSVVMWTAAIDGVAVQLKVGEGDYAAYVDSVYAEVDDYWGAEPTITPQLTDDQIGKTLVVTATTVINGEIIIETADVEVGGVFTAILSTTWSNDGIDPGFEATYIHTVSIIFRAVENPSTVLAYYTTNLKDR